MAASLLTEFHRIKDCQPFPFNANTVRRTRIFGPCPRGRSSKVAIVNKREELLLFALKINVSIIFLDDMIKLSVKKTK